MKARPRRGRPRRLALEALEARLVPSNPDTLTIPLDPVLDQFGDQVITAQAYGDEVRTARAYSLGAVDFMSSPIIPEVLRTKVRVFVDLFLLAQQSRRQAAHASRRPSDRLRRL